MDRIIAFILDNFLIVVIAAGFLLSLFRKAGGSPQRMPDFGGGGRDFMPQGRSFKETRQGNPVQSQSAMEPIDRPAAMPMYETHRMLPSAGMMPGGEGSPGAEGDYGATEGRQTRPARLPVRPALESQPDIGTEELRKAVVWAEILGPPRARAPHGRRQR